MGLQRRVSVATVLAASLLVACATDGGDAQTPLTMSSLTADPETYDGEFVRLDAAYYGAFEESVLTSGFRESDPPQPVEPLIWVGVSPGEECLQISERASFAERVEASGTFRYDPEGGFGHLGEYEMAIENAELVCVRSVS